MTPSAENGLHRRVRNPDSIDTCAGCGWEGWDTAPTFEEHLPRAEKDASACEHDWVFDGYFWHHCRNCGRVS